MAAVVAPRRSGVRDPFLIALGVSGDGPGDTPEEVANYFADDGNRGTEFFVFFLLVALAVSIVLILRTARVADWRTSD